MVRPITYDPATRRLRIGEGVVENVPPAVAAYEVSGVGVLDKWFSYRRADRSRPVIGDRRPPSELDRVQPAGWLPDDTTDLLDLLHVLGRVVLLEPAQARLLDDVLAGPRLASDALVAAGALALPDGTGTAAAAPATQGDLFAG